LLTAWLAPPPGLSHSNHVTKIEPEPIAISATIALLVGVILIVLLSRKDKEVFLGDRITSASETEKPSDASRPVKTRNKTPLIISAPQVLHVPPTQIPPTNPPPRFDSPKLNAVLSWKDEVDFGHINKAQPVPAAHLSYYAPPRSQHDEYYSDDEPLKDDQRNSAYVPYPHSDASGGVYYGDTSRLGAPNRAHAYNGDSTVRRSPLSLASKTRLGDAY
jgi:hypothetical protein